MILRAFLNFLDLLGRRKTFAAFTGIAFNNRWFIGYVENDEDARPIAKLPNLYLHQNLERESPDGPDEHYHAWNTWSLILSGGYWQVVDGALSFHGRWSIVRLKHTQRHRIVRCLPNTWTLFFHGWRVSTWRLKVQGCSVLCSTCGPAGTCYAASHDIPYDIYFGGAGGKYRRGRWFKWTPELERTLRIRRKALEKGGDRIKPLSRDELNAEICRAAHEAA